MADCYYHGYTGGPGACRSCEIEEERGLEPGTLGFGGMSAADAYDVSLKDFASPERRRRKERER